MFRDRLGLTWVHQWAGIGIEGMVFPFFDQFFLALLINRIDWVIVPETTNKNIAPYPIPIEANFSFYLFFRP